MGTRVDQYPEVDLGGDLLLLCLRANRNSFRARSLRVVSEARRAMRLPEHGVFARFRYNDLKEAARDLRRTRALCKFNGGKERRRVVPRLCCRARHLTV